MWDFQLAGWRAVWWVRHWADLKALLWAEQTAHSWGSALAVLKADSRAGQKAWKWAHQWADLRAGLKARRWDGTRAGCSAEQWVDLMVVSSADWKGARSAVSMVEPWAVGWGDCWADRWAGERAGQWAFLMAGQKAATRAVSTVDLLELINHQNSN